MPISHKTKWLGVHDAKIRKMLTDPEAGTATYSTSIDVPGIKAIGLGGSVKSVDLRGDNQLLDSNAVLETITLELSHAKLSLDVLDIMIGSTTVDSGTGTAEVATLTLSGDDTPGYWQFEAMTKGVDVIGGDGHIVLDKCIISGMPDIGFAEEDYRIFSGAAKAIPRIADLEWLKLILNETAVAIA